MAEEHSVPSNRVQQRLLIHHLYAMLEEDIGFGDITTNALVASSQTAQASIITHQNGVVAGLELAAAFLTDLEISKITYEPDGSRVKPNDILLQAEGPAATFLTVERVLLNLLQRMCGIATLTARMVDAVQQVQPNVRIAATRKTAPLLRIFDKLAVMAGGGDPHRWRLDDAVLIKDNHLVFFTDITKAIVQARERVSFTCPIEIEVKLVKDAIAAAETGADAILLDNMNPASVTAAVKAVQQLDLPKIPLIEVSGNITYETISEYAKTGVDIISIGELTHSVSALDLSLNLKPL